MKYHLSGGVWMRCRAVKRAGQGVTNCPIGANAHVVGRQGIAARGGGIEERTENGERIQIKISRMKSNGTFTATSHKGFVRVYRGDGSLMKLRDRAKSGAPISVAPMDNLERELRKSFAFPKKPNPIRDRIEAAGIKYPLSWDEMGSSEKDLWEDRMVARLDKLEQLRNDPRPRVKRDWDNTPNSLVHFFDGKNKYFSPQGVVDHDPRGGLNVELIIRQLWAREGKAPEDRAFVDAGKFEVAVLKISAYDFDLFEWVDSDERKFLQGVIPDALREIEAEYETIELMAGRDVPDNF